MSLPRQLLQLLLLRQVTAQSQTANKRNSYALLLLVAAHGALP
jgi:hypothetical protein